MRPPSVPTTTNPLSLRLLLLVLTSVVLTTCEDEVPMTAPEVTPPSFAISDALHSDGNPDFFFLPPLVADPSDHEEFDPEGFDGTQPAEVTICVLSGDDCGAIIAEYSMETGPGSETVRVSETDQLYIVNWRTDEADLEETETYRVTVLVAETPLRYADVKAYANAQAARPAYPDMKPCLPHFFLPTCDGAIHQHLQPRSR